jgi:6,7-dimethyl-8-ribityllumazine synthase
MLPGKPKKFSRNSTRNLRIAIVAAQYNPELVDALLDYTVSTLSANKVRSIEAVRVPGSYEIPLLVSKLAKSKKFQAIIALGVVFQGKTSHADHITLAATLHLQQISIETGIPVIHQILTPKNLKDAKARISVRGVEAANTAIQMAETLANLKL